MLINFFLLCRGQTPGQQSGLQLGAASVTRMASLAKKKPANDEYTDTRQLSIPAGSCFINDKDKAISHSNSF
jgi:hypothetical protein